MRPNADAMPVVDPVRHALVLDNRLSAEDSPVSFANSRSGCQVQKRICLSGMKVVSGKLPVTFLMLLGFTFSSLSFSSTAQAQAEGSASCGSRQTESIHAYVKRTRGWLPQNYQVQVLAARIGSDRLAAYQVVPDVLLRESSSIALPHEIYLDRETCEVVGEYTLPRPAVRISGESDEVQQ